MAGRGTKTIIPDKLQRFLRTTAMRDNIRETNVAAVIITKGDLIVSERGLPAKAVNGGGINSALDELLDDLRIDAIRGITYIGYCDCNGTRQYNFGIDAKPARICGLFRTITIENAIRLLGKNEARTVVAALRKKAV
ncbi:MAG: hypothetical protein PHF60_03870 [Candidatus ainarchaeum sp.]|nr:hypothetical protein [Candidatus ainarchaeum sp.]